MCALKDQIKRSNSGKSSNSTTPVNTEFDENYSIELSLSKPHKEEKKFTVSGTAFHLVYKKHLDKELFWHFLEEKIEQTDTNLELDDLYIGHENGHGSEKDEQKLPSVLITPYKHTHVYFSVRNKDKDLNRNTITFKGADFFDFTPFDKTKPIHPHVGKIPSNKKDKIRCMVYVTKEDVYERAKLKKDHPEFFSHELDSKCKKKKPTPYERLIKAGNDPLEVLKIAESPSDFIPNEFARKIAFANQTIEVQEPKYQWQKDLIKEIENYDPEQGTRDIIWYLDREGSTGKTSLNKYLAATMKKKVITLSTLQGDVSHLVIQQAERTGWTGGAIVVDIPRSREHSYVNYSTIEILQNGDFTSTKYNGSRMIAHYSKVIIFSNFFPDIRQMSHDRWKIRVLVKEDGDYNKPKLLGECRVGRNYNIYDSITKDFQPWMELFSDHGFNSKGKLKAPSVLNIGELVDSLRSKEDITYLHKLICKVYQRKVVMTSKEDSFSAVTRSKLDDGKKSRSSSKSKISRSSVKKLLENSSSDDDD